MKIAVMGTTNIGKTTYIKDFLKKWEMYKSPEKSYREILKEKNLPHSKSSNEATQAIIMNFLIDQITENSNEKFMIFDRCVIDCLAYSTWLNLNGLLSDKFLDQQRILASHAIRLYDLILFIPMTKAAKVEIHDDNFRETDPIFREEIDNIFKAFQVSYHKQDGAIFPKEDCPAIIEIFGSPEERVKMTEFYIKEDGTGYGENESLLNGVISPHHDDLTLEERDALER